MFASQILFIFVTFSCFSYSIQQSQQVNVTLYYESLCPFCHEFIVEQLYPGYQQLGDSLLVDLVPFGKASSNLTDNGIEWTCQHGPLECYLNKVDACVINMNLAQSDELRYLNCRTAGSSRDNTTDEVEALAQKCTSDIKVSWNDITTCLTDGTADNLLLGYEDRQSKLDPKLRYVPNIRFNDVYNEDLENSARLDFLYTACELFTADKPSVCN